MATENNVLNLDLLIPPQQIVRLHGKDHLIDPPSVETYLKFMQTAPKAGRGVDPDVVNMQQSIELIKLSCPTIPEDQIRSLPMKAMAKLVDLIQSYMEIEDEAGDLKTGEGDGSGE